MKTVLKRRHQGTNCDWQKLASRLEETTTSIRTAFKQRITIWPQSHKVASNDMHIFKPSTYLWLAPTVLATDLAVQGGIIQQTTFCPVEPFGTWRASGICPVDELKSASNETTTTTTTSPGDDWVRGDLCLEIPSGSDSKYCTFTHPSFNHGFGLSVVTTPEMFQRFAGLPVFGRDRHLHPLEGEKASPFRDVQIPGKGVGLVTTRPVEAKEVYMARTPAVMLDDTAFRLLGRSRLTALLTRAVDDLPHAHRAEYLNLTTHSEVGSHTERVYEIFMKNNFRTEVHNLEVFHSAFTQVSRLNHACRPNSDYFFDDATLSHNVFAARKVEPGEELTVTYSDPVQTYMNRHMYLLHHWGFECTCSLCTASESEMESSDTRIEEIRSLWADLDNYTPESAGTPQKAERLIELYHEEDLVTRMVEAYYRAAVEWNGVGNSDKAKMFAEKAISAGEIMESGIRPFMNVMRELANNPEGHWTWRFRIRNNT